MDWIHLLGGVLGSGALVGGSFFFIKEGEVGVKTTFGKAKRDSNDKVVLVNPGFRLVVPGVQSIMRVHTRKNTTNYTDLNITLKSGLSYKFNAYIIYHVIKEPDAVDNVLFSLENYEEFVQITFEKAIQQSLEGLQQIDNTKVNKRLTEIIQPILFKEGITVDDCGLVSFSATDVTQNLEGLKYKVKLVNDNPKLDRNILAAIVGATPIVNIGQYREKEEEVEDAILSVTKTK